METIAQFLSKNPALAAATENLRYKKRLRRAVIESVKKLEGSTSKRDLAKKVIADITSSDAKMSLLFNVNELNSYSKSALIWNGIEESVALSINTYLGLLQKSNLECDLLWQSARKTVLKNLEGNMSVHLSGSKDSYRVYITDGNAEIAQVDNITPALLLDKDVKDRARYQTPRQITAIKMSSEKALLLFHDFSNGFQRRFLVPLSRLDNFTFESINKSYIQDGTHLVRKDYTGDEFNVNQFGELVGERDGVDPTAWVLDVCFRGRTGNVGEKGGQGPVGKEATTFGIRTGELATLLDSEGKRLITTKADYERALVERDGWVLPMKKSFIDLWKTK